MQAERIRFVEIPTDRMFRALRGVGAKVMETGGKYIEQVTGNERVVEFHPPRSLGFVRVFTTVADGAATVRECDSDAVRIVVLTDVGARLVSVTEPIKVLRTAPQDGDRVGAFIERLQNRIRASYGHAMDTPACPKCGAPMAHRTSQRGMFWGCTSYPSCHGVRQLKPARERASPDVNTTALTREHPPDMPSGEVLRMANEPFFQTAPSPTHACYPYGYTHIDPIGTTRMAELRALVRHALDRPLNWRRHAFGCLQAYLAEDADPEVRIHIWHPALVKVEPLNDGGRIHDHRFELSSTVLAGSVGHEEVDAWPVDRFTPQTDSKTLYTEWTVQHARAGSAPLTQTSRVMRTSHRASVIQAGSTYSFPALQFHRSFVPEPAVTLVSKIGQRPERARLLFPVGYEPSFGVGPVDDDTLRDYLNVARSLLSTRL